MPSADVYKKGKLAAHLERNGGQVTFQYLNSYIAQNGEPVASTLPLSNEPIILPNGATPPYFAGLLPEGGRLTAMAKTYKKSKDDELGLLLEIGSDLIGDVQVLRAGGNPNSEREVFMLPSEPSEIDFEVLRRKFFGTRASGIAGVQDKISSKMLNAPARMADVDYIIKLNPPDVPHAVENEYYFLQLANKCGIKTAEFQLLTDGKGQHALRLTRFDRIKMHEGKLRLAAEDGCQVSNKYPLEKYEMDFLDMSGALIKLCPARGVAGYRLFEQLVFNWLIGNGDAHAKNYSILETPEGEWRVSPAYDLLCTLFYQDRTVAMSLAGEKTSWNRELLISAAKQMYVPERAAEKVIDKQLSVLVDLPQAIIDGALPFIRSHNSDVARRLKRRALSLAN